MFSSSFLKVVTAEIVQETVQGHKQHRPLVFWTSLQTKPFDICPLQLNCIDEYLPLQKKILSLIAPAHLREGGSGFTSFTINLVETLTSRNICWLLKWKPWQQTRGKNILHCKVAMSPGCATALWSDTRLRRNFDMFTQVLNGTLLPLQ